MSEGLYGAVKFLSTTNSRLYHFAKEHDIPNPVKSEDYHTTFIYSRKSVPIKTLGKLPDPVEIKHSTFEWDLFGPSKNILVIKFESMFLHYRWKYAMDRGASYDFPEYIPHVTLSYDAEGFDHSKLPLPKFDLYIGEEYTKPLED